MDVQMQIVAMNKADMIIEIYIISSANSGGSMAKGFIYE